MSSMSSEEKEKEQAFVLEQQNLALAQQYFSIKDEITQLHTSNTRYCNELKKAQDACFKYQTIFQMLFTRVNHFIDTYSPSGAADDSSKAQEVLDVFGNDVLSDDALSRILSSFVTPLSNDWSIPEEEPTEEDEPSKRLRVDTQQAGAILQRLDVLEHLVRGNASPSTPLSASGLRADALRAAVESAGSRMEALMGEIASLRRQVKQLQRDKAKLQAAPTEPVATEASITPSQSVSASTSMPSTTASMTASMTASTTASTQSGAGEETGGDAEKEELAKQVKALQLQVESRGEAVQAAEKDAARLREHVATLQATLVRREQECEEAARARERETENHRYCVDALQHDWRREEAEFAALRDDGEALLRRVEAELAEGAAAAQKEQEQGRAAAEKALGEAAQVKRERDAFEKKLKRRKLFGEVLADAERAIAKLRDAVKQGEAGNAGNAGNGTEAARVEVLKSQLKDMSEAFRSCEALLHKTKNLVIFGDKKNDQLLSEFLELQKACDELRAEKDRGVAAQKEQEQEAERLRAENAELRASNEALEAECARVVEEVRAVHGEVMAAVASEDSFERQAAEKEKEAARLRREVEELGGTVQSLRGSVKRERFRFEQRLLNMRGENEKEVIDLMQEEMHRYRTELMCPLCKVRPKDCILARCQHIFCRECVEERIARRERKCPRCLLPFGTDDVKRVWIINDPQLYEDLKDMDK